MTTKKAFWALAALALAVSASADVTTNPAATGIGGGGGSGSVTSVSVSSANGLAGTVANATTTPAITLSTSVNGIAKGNGTALSAATSGTDYAPPTSGSSILYGNGAGGFSNATVGSGLSFAGGTLSSTATGNNPGGSGSELQYRAGATTFGAVSGSATSANGSLTLGGAIVTASDPVLNLSQTWNNSGVTFKGLTVGITDTASSSSSLLLDMQVGGTSMFTVKKNGDFNFRPVSSSNALAYTSNNSVLSAGGGFLSFVNNRIYIGDASRNKISGANAVVYGWISAAGQTVGDGATGGTLDTGLARAAAAVPEVNNGTKGAYTGTALLLGSQTVAQLPSCAAGTTGARASVSDATQTFSSANFGTAVTGGGANFAPVVCDGTSWKIG